MTYDVIVIGAGPAGAVAASLTARKGLSTLLIEKEHLPRYMACGGGLTQAITKYIDFDYSATVERVVTGLTLSYKQRPEYTLCPPGLKIEMVARNRFDHRMVEQAVRSGAKLIEGIKIVAVEEGRLLSFNRGCRTLNTKRICLVGDAASLVDPLTGEGIRHAIHSGVLAADRIHSSLNKSGSLTEQYTRDINEQIVEDFIHAMWLARLFYRLPPLLYMSKKYAREIGQLLNGEARYRDFIPRLYKWLGLLVHP